MCMTVLCCRSSIVASPSICLSAFTCQEQHTGLGNCNCKHRQTLYTDSVCILSKGNKHATSSYSSHKSHRIGIRYRSYESVLHRMQNLKAQAKYHSRLLFNWRLNILYLTAASESDASFSFQPSSSPG